MPATENTSQATQPPPTSGAVGRNGHPLPRRTSAANSVTLRHHRIARDASQKAPNSQMNSNSTSSRRNSSGDSHDTGQSDPTKWFDQSNQNPTATFDNNTMDVDPPFFQKETESSNEGGRSYYQQRMAAPPKLDTAQSSSADEYRSVIDDLTVEIQKLKDELKRHKQNGPDMLRKDKLFEIKIHGLPKRKKRELESTLRDFTSGLGSSPDPSSSRKNQSSSKHNTRDRLYSNSGSISKHASSSSGSHTRPVDSAYASMSTGANSSGASLGRPSRSSRAKSSEQKVESYLRDIPEGLYPRHVLMTDKDKKKIVVKRLEQLFTGKITGRAFRKPQQQQQQPQDSKSSVTGVMTDGDNKQQALIHQPPSLETRGTTASGTCEASREARILPPEQHTGGKKSGSRDNGSASNSGGDQTESGGTHGSNNTSSPPNPSLPEQRPTRLKDLDPDRTQVPTENMEYIKHLGLVPPELLDQPAQDVHPDAEGWVYLNLLCNLAQLHMINVTPDFVRSAVSGVSTKFQLSPDGRKIRWRGGTEGTRFSSDSSGENTQNNSPDYEDLDHSHQNTSVKRQKTGHSTGDDFRSGSSSKHASKFGVGADQSESFHYKPLLLHRSPSYEQTSMDETLSSFGPVEDSNIDASRWDNSGSGNTSGRKKRRRDGAIIYYSGAPFCTDLAGEPGDASPMTYMMSTGQEQEQQQEQVFARPGPLRTASGSSLPYRPLAQKDLFPGLPSKMDIDSPPGLSADSGNETDDDEIDLDLGWSGQQQYIRVHSLDPCGLGGVMPEDHFMVVVTTKRPKEEIPTPLVTGKEPHNEATADGIVNRLASMSTSSPGPLNNAASSRSPLSGLEIEYTSGRIRRLAPVRLPPPAVFFPPFSSDGSSSSDDMLSSSEGDDEPESGQPTSRHADGHRSDGYPDGVDLTSGDEDGEDPDNEPDTKGMYDDEDYSRPHALPGRRQSSAEAAAGTSARGRSKSASIEVAGRSDSSSLATGSGGS